jgi:hypothetical protein
MRGAVDKMLEFSLFQIKNNVTLSGITQNVNSQQADFHLKSNDYPPFLSMTLPIIYTPDGKMPSGRRAGRGGGREEEEDGRRRLCPCNPFATNSARSVIIDW